MGAEKEKERERGRERSKYGTDRSRSQTKIRGEEMELTFWRVEERWGRKEEGGGGENAILVVLRNDQITQLYTGTLFEVPRRLGASEQVSCSSRHLPLAQLPSALFRFHTPGNSGSFTIFALLCANERATILTRRVSMTLLPRRGALECLARLFRHDNVGLPDRGGNSDAREGGGESSRGVEGQWMMP